MVLLMKLLAVLVVGGGAIAGGTGAALTLTGTPKPCVGRVAYLTSIDSDIARSKWEIFKIQAASGPATVEFTEAEVTSLGAEFIGGKVENFQVFFCPQGYAEATGTTNGIDFLVRGDLDITGPAPKVRVLDVEAGGLPTVIPVQSLVPGIDEQNTYLDLGVKIASIRYDWPNPGEVQITGVPN